MRNLEDYILVVDDVLSAAECKMIITALEGSDLWARSTEVCSIANGKQENIRSSEQHAITVYKEQLPKGVEIDELLFEKVTGVLKRFTEIAPSIIVSSDEGYTVVKYPVGGKFGQHTDYYRSSKPTLALSIALNDDFTGGEWKFFNGEKVVKLKQGAAIIFPANFLYPHENAKVTKGTKYAVTTWFI